MGKREPARRIKVFFARVEKEELHHRAKVQAAKERSSVEKLVVKAVEEYLVRQKA